jgi:hypothetical protein
MATIRKHGTRRGYGAGCRCDACKQAQRVYQRQYRERVASGTTRPAPLPLVTQLPPAELQPAGPGPVEAAVEIEISGLAHAQLRPGLVAIAAAWRESSMAKSPPRSQAPQKHWSAC